MALAAATQLTEATVFRVLRGRGRWPRETRDRVFRAADELKYRPNMLVQGIQTGRTQTVGVLLPVADDFFGRVFAGVHEALVQVDQVPILLWCKDQLDPRAASAPCAVLVKADAGQISISVSDPTQLAKRVELSLGDNVARAMEIDERIKVESTEPPRITVNLEKADGKPIVARFAP